MLFIDNTVMYKYPTKEASVRLICVSYVPGQDLQAGVVKIHASTQSMFLECGGFSRKQLYLEEVV